MQDISVEHLLCARNCGQYGVPNREGANIPVGEAYKQEPTDFPGGPVVRNPPANAENMSSIPGPGRSHMQQSNEAWQPPTAKPVSLEPALRNKRSHRNERPTHCNEE